MVPAEQNDAAGLAYALAGFALLSSGDAVIKSMADEWPGTAVAALRFSLGAIGLAAIVGARGGRSALRLTRPGLQFARGAALAFSSLMFFLGIFLMPLAEATTIGFISPMFAALYSFLLLKERPPAAIGPAIALGMAGVLLVLRPNFAEIGWPALLPLLAAAGFSLMLVLNRMAAADGDVIAMQYAISAVAAPLLIVTAAIMHYSGVAAFQVAAPDWSVVARCAFVAVSATFAHALIYMATARASAGAIAPMVYVQLLIAMLLGAIFYGEWPDATALVGAALVMAGGLYLWRKTERL